MVRTCFSRPIPCFSALAMAVEGASGETARQMGAVLRFPDAARRLGDDAQLVPWNTALIHPGRADLGRGLPGADVDEQKRTQGIRRRIEQLEHEHKTLNMLIAQIETEYVEKDADVQRLRGQLLETQAGVDAVAGELNKLRQQVDQYEIRIANALWGDQTFPFRHQFLDRLRDAYGAAAISVDFIHEPEAVRIRINRWVEQQTNDRIKELIAPEGITADTRLVLTNAIYFKGNWADEFEQENTAEYEFTLGDGTRAKAMLMASRSMETRYAELTPDGTRNDPVVNRESFVHELKPNPDGFQLLELQYRGNNLFMVVVLPKKYNDLPALEKSLTSDNLRSWLRSMREQEVHVYLPKFRMETTYDLRTTLLAMGMTAAFQPGGFTRLSDSVEADGICISNVVHKAFVDVNEKGTQAAAATELEMITGAIMLDEPLTPTFRADRPFIFLILDNRTGSVLLCGRMTNPNHYE